MGHDAADQHRSPITEARIVHVPFPEVSLILADDAQAVVGAHGRRIGDQTMIDLSAHSRRFGIGLSSEAVVDVGTPRAEPGPIPAVTVPLSWRAAHRTGLFPTMDGALEAFPATVDRTELVITGEYEPPLGRVGELADRALLHRVASAVVAELLESVADEIRKRRRDQ